MEKIINKFFIIFFLTINAFYPVKLFSEDKSKSIVSNASYNNEYILGVGDTVGIRVLDIEKYSGDYLIGPDSNIYLPTMKPINASGLTLKQLEKKLTKKLSSRIKDPVIYIEPIKYRSIKVYVGGEVATPGYYIFGNENNNVEQNQKDLSTLNRPTLFDALRQAKGITVYSDLQNIVVTRKLPSSEEGYSLKTNLSILDLITKGDESQNIELRDGDSIFVKKSSQEVRGQIINSAKRNLNPEEIRVYVTGRVREPGIKILPQGSSLYQALAASGGQKVIKGKIDFVRLDNDGNIDRRKIKVSQKDNAGSYQNPTLMNNDIIRVGDSPLSATLDVLNDITKPALGIYAITELIED